MRIFFWALVVIASQDVLAKCFERPSFYQYNKIYKTAAIGYFNQSKNKLTFNPLVCMNRKKCSIIDLSNFPQYKREQIGIKLGKLMILKTPMPRIWQLLIQLKAHSN